MVSIPIDCGRTSSGVGRSLIFLVLVLPKKFAAKQLPGPKKLPGWRVKTPAGYQFWDEVTVKIDDTG